MTFNDITERIENIINLLKEREEIEQKIEDMTKLVTKISHVNDKLSDVFWAYSFIKDFETNEELENEFKVLYESYDDLRNVFIKLRNETDRIDIIEPNEFIKSLEDIQNLSAKLELKILKLKESLLEKINTEKTLASSLNIIPDIMINIEIFKEAEKFLRSLGTTIKDIVGFTGKDKNTIKDKIKSWRSIELKIEKERAKMDLKNIKGISLSTIKFLEKLIKNKGEIEFIELDSTNVIELKREFPELSKKLRLMIC